MDDFDKLLAEQLKNKEFFKEWENSELEYRLTRLLIDTRIKANLTQKQLSQLSGIRQSNISRIENGDALPTLKTLDAIARSVGKKLYIEIK